MELMCAHRGGLEEMVSPSWAYESGVRNRFYEHWPSVPQPVLLNKAAGDGRQPAGLELIHGFVSWLVTDEVWEGWQSVRPESKGGSVCVFQLTGDVQSDLVLP